MGFARAVPILLLIPLALLFSCDEDSVGSQLHVSIKVEEDHWNSWTPNNNHTYISNIYDVARADEFGPIAGDGHGLFEVVQVVSADCVEVLFNESLVVVGEPISKPTSYASITVSKEKICLRTRTYDAGVDYCLFIVEATKGGN